MTVISFALIFPAFATATIANGQFNRDAYAFYGLIGSVTIFVAIMVSALGTHRYIPNLRQPPPKRDMSLGKIFREIYDTVSSRSFFALFFASLLSFYC